MNYKSNEYQRMAQRFVYPIYTKDELGNFNFSSTMTYLKYKEIYFCVFAAHALNKNSNIKSIGYLGTDGVFTSFGDIEVFRNYKVFQEHDIVVCNSLPFELKNYFDLDNDNGQLNVNKILNWIGFPAKKAKEYHRTKSSVEYIKKDISRSDLDDGVPKLENAEYLWLKGKIVTNNDIQISASFENKKVTYQHEGYKENGYSPKGMSGGALFFFKGNNSNSVIDINKMFKFAGIGLEYNGKLIKGVSRKLMIKILDMYIENTL